MDSHANDDNCASPPRDRDALVPHGKGETSAGLDASTALPIRDVERAKFFDAVRRLAEARAVLVLPPNAKIEIVHDPIVRLTDEPRECAR